MTLNQFISQFDKKDSIVLLEGKRKVAEADKEKLVALGALLTENTSHMTFRSGNAAGSDEFFSKGVAKVNSQRLQVITPYTGHRKKANLAHETISLDDVNMASEPEVVYQSQGNKKMKGLIDKFVEGNRNRYTIKAAYILRDTIKAIGTSDVKPATFGIFYDDLTDPESGGTGHTMKICKQNQIPIIDQHTWFQWLE